MGVKKEQYEHALQQHLSGRHAQSNVSKSCLRPTSLHRSGKGTACCSVLFNCRKNVKK